MGKNAETISEIRKKITKTHELIFTAFHEAGHTIYSLLHFMPVSSVSIFENKKLKRIHGLTYYEYPIKLELIEDSEIIDIFIKNEVGVYYAGLVAEKMLFKNISGSDQIPMFAKLGSAEDNKAAIKIIKQFNLAVPGKKRYLYKKKLCKEIVLKFLIHWDAINIVSHALFKYHQLSFDDLQNLLIKKSQNKKFWKEQFKIIKLFYNQSNFNEKYLKEMLLQ